MPDPKGHLSVEISMSHCLGWGVYPGPWKAFLRPGAHFFLFCFLLPASLCVLLYSSPTVISLLWLPFSHPSLGQPQDHCPFLRLCSSSFPLHAGPQMLCFLLDATLVNQSNQHSWKLRACQVQRWDYETGTFVSEVSEFPNPIITGWVWASMLF